MIISILFNEDIHTLTLLPSSNRTAQMNLGIVGATPPYGEPLEHVQSSPQDLQPSPAATSHLEITNA